MPADLPVDAVIHMLLGDMLFGNRLFREIRGEHELGLNPLQSLEAAIQD